MKEEIYERFHLYLCDVVSYYQENKTLKNFSDIAKKWGVKAIPKELFYVYNLHQLNGQPTRQVSDKIRDILSKQDAIRRKKNRFHHGDVVAWERNGQRSVALLESDKEFIVCLNYRSREDEKDRVWVHDSMPDDVVVEKANMEDVLSLLRTIVKEKYKLIE